MKLIIDIEDEALERLSTADPNLLYTAIKNGTPITDGDLISRHKLLLAIEQQIAYLRSVGHNTYLMGLDYSKQYVNGAPAIGEEDDDDN